VPANNASSCEHVVGTTCMYQLGSRLQGGIDGGDRFEFIPRHRKAREVQPFDGRLLAHDNSDRLSAKARLVFREHRLIREAWDHAVGIFPRHMLGSEDGVNPRMAGSEL